MSHATGSPTKAGKGGTGAATTVSLALAAAVMLLLLYATTGPSAQGVSLRINLDSVSGLAGRARAAVTGADPAAATPAADPAAAEEQRVVQATLQQAEEEGLRPEQAQAQQQQARQQQKHIEELERQLLMEREARQHLEQQAFEAARQAERAAAQREEEEEEAEEQQAAEPKKAPAQAPQRSGQQKSADFTAAISKCLWWDCFAQQKDLEPGPGQFRFPHFYILGFQKCATTSLFHHLSDHPQVLEPVDKEPEFYTRECGFNTHRCPRTVQLAYFEETLKFSKARDAGFKQAAFEGSTHYALEGRWLAAQMRDVFPWLRLLVSMREPISQSISMVFHNLDSGRLPPCYVAGKGLIYTCCLQYLDRQSRYATHLRPWIQHFPRDQLYVFQYKNLTAVEHTADALTEVKTFLGLDPALPSNKLPLNNARHQTKQTEGWPMKRSEYEQLIGVARRNMEEVIEIVQEHRFADPEAWRANWEAAWKDNLDNRCGAAPDSDCMIQLT